MRTVCATNQIGGAPNGTSLDRIEPRLYANAEGGAPPKIEVSVKPSTTRGQLGGRDSASCEGDRETRRRDAVGQQLS